MEVKRILVTVLMGSDSDWTVMKAAEATLQEFGVACDVRVISAHRSPNLLATYLEEAQARGVRIIIAGAGGAAHLAGVVASATPLPVIGVPLKSWALDGLDALLSTVQMPPGVPVATVAINGARNAALLAVQILALGDETIAASWEAYRSGMEKSVMERDARVQAERG